MNDRNMVSVILFQKSGFSQCLILLTFLVFPFTLHSQDLFESSFFESDSSRQANYQLGGYFRSGIFGNENTIREKYVEGTCKLVITGNKYGNAQVEMRYRASNGINGENNGFWLREGYVNLYFGKFDFRIGQQVVVWGRADGFNPTNNVTPTDFIVFSPDEDDKRLSTFIAKGTYNCYPFKLEMDWIPGYKASILPFGNASLPPGVSRGEDHTPSLKWKNSSFGVKLDWEKPTFDGSVSYYKGYHKMPGLNYACSSGGAEIFTLPWKTQVFGADFSTAAGSFGLRGECAFTLPDSEPDSLFSSPCKQLEYTLGVDREWGNFSLIVQYVGKYIFDFDKEITAQTPLAKEVIRYNRMLFSQLEAWNHSVSIRPSISLMHETLKCEMFGLVNFSTEEWFLMPKATYSISDALTFCIGVQLFGGGTNTLYGFIKKSRNSGFAELKLSF